MDVSVFITATLLTLHWAIQHDLVRRRSAVPDEKIMRRSIARELRHASNSLYTVYQEAVTADEKETDIRLRSLLGECEAVIELKIGDKRTAKDLIGTVENQLVRKYMAPKGRKSGALLMTIARNRVWMHPSEKRRIGVDELIDLLRDEAERVQAKFGGAILIAIHFLDLRPRLPIEREGRSADRGAGLET